ncbi:endonuclease/exonuclease/phosphatase family protein [Wenzhouxiangella sp. XN79A]|uniref:endonuclease/exonuclease/phosphatase family protein n=1 Tax=Wenzhouxiangella sp. XN79A TaxID=2724193 RepID=UPI00144AC6BC|nr:endonuclease/exonuclease/phosphatase family protein [Wenzhouxiangella sp. XN79A]NKI34170.1 endonuclease/exonuclease/phosphatase family protein [Wenzhouxiangella sp. XN79A]
MKRLYALSLLLVLAACASGPGVDPSADAARPESQAYEWPSVSIMAFNVENLFDTADDPGKNDATYLPASVKADPEHVAACELIEVDRWREDCLYLDWSEDALAFKLEQLAATILAYNDGRGPDIIALQEVENIAVLDRLRREHLQPAGYRLPVLIEGLDDRGIDVAFLSRLPVVGEPVLHPIDMSAFPDRAPDTRGILEANFELPDGTVLTGYSVHFPAPFHPMEMRWIAYEHLNQLRARVPEDRPVFAAGDFNTPKREMDDTTIMDEMVRPYWTVAHEVGCTKCRGTNYWQRGESWSFLDMVLFSPSSSHRWTLDVDAIDVVTGYADQLHADGTPKRFDPDAREGVSDHLPIVMVLVYRP